MDNRIIEENIRQIESVLSTKIVLDQDQKIEEIHVVSNGHRAPKQIARDVQSVLLATYNLDVDHKKISIAQIPDDSLGRNMCRVRLTGLSQETNGTKATVKVSLTKQGEEYIHSLSGINTTRNIERMLVESTLASIQTLCGYDDIFIFEDIRTIQISGSSVVVVCVTGVLNGREQKLSGSCIVNSDYYNAVVKATLDAVNRFVTK